MVFDPLAMNNGNVPSAASAVSAPPQAFAQYGTTTAAPQSQTNTFAANNANVFRNGHQTQPQPMQPIQPVFAANNAKVLATPAKQPQQHRAMNSIQRGNDS